MIPFYPKLGSAPEFVRDQIGEAKSAVKDQVLESTKASLKAADALRKLEAKRAINEAQKSRLIPGRYSRAIAELEKMYPGKEEKVPTKAASARDSFVSGLDPLAGNVAMGAIEDTLNPDVTAQEMRKRKLMAALGGAVSGGVLVPGALAIAAGAGKGALKGGARQVLPGAKAVLGDTFHRASTPVLAGSAGLGALGAKSQYELGGSLAEMARDKTASSLKSYGAFAGMGAAGLGGLSLMQDKDKIIRDMRLRRLGKIDNQELSERLRQYGTAAGIHAGAGGALGAAGLHGFRKIVKPELLRAGDEVAQYAGQKVEEASKATLKNIDDLAEKHRLAGQQAAEDLANRQRQAYAQQISTTGDELVEKLRTADLLEGTRQGMAAAASNKAQSVRDRLRGMNPFAKRKTPGQIFSEGLRGTPSAAGA